MRRRERWLGAGSLELDWMPSYRLVRSYAGAEGGSGEWEDEAGVVNGDGAAVAGKTARGEARSASVKKSGREWEGRGQVVNARSSSSRKRAGPVNKFVELQPIRFLLFSPRAGGSFKRTNLDWPVQGDSVK
jgi:hypothetical protein